MKVVSNSNTAGHFGITPGGTYLLVGMDHDSYRVVNEIGDPAVYPRQVFVEQELSAPSDWIVRRFDADEFYAYPPELACRGFFEDWFDGHRDKRQTLQTYIESLSVGSQ